MRLLRIFAPKPDKPTQWQWALADESSRIWSGEGALPQLPANLLKRAERIQVVLPATFVLIARARLPPGANRRSGTLLAYAVEETTATEPDVNAVSWVGSVGDAEILSVMDRRQLDIWREDLSAAGIHAYGMTCESLLLPREGGKWSCVWDGLEGFVRAGELEGAATDCGDRQTPPLSLILALQAARARNAAPDGIDLYATEPDKVPDINAWRRALGVAIHSAGRWERFKAPLEAGVELAAPRRKWRVDPQTFAKLRPAAWIAVIALAIHATALAVDWARLAAEQEALRAQMETRFRSLYPDAISVADPALQMRRKLAEARRAANKPDEGDFAVMISKAAGALKPLPAGALRAISYESGRMTLEFAADDPALPGRVSAQLAQSGFVVTTMAPQGPGRRTAALTLRAP